MSPVTVTGHLTEAVGISTIRLMSHPIRVFLPLHATRYTVLDNLLPITRKGDSFMIRSLGVAVCVCAFLSTGCAFGTRYVSLTYEPQGTANAPKAIALSVAPLTDSRPAPEVVGHVLNGWGMKTAKVVATNNVENWIRRALISELREAGYTVTDSSDGPVILGGTIINIKCDSYFTYEGTIHLMIRLTRNGNVVLDRAYVGEGSTGLNWAATSTSFAKVLEDALHNAMMKVVADVTQVLEKPVP